MLDADFHLYRSAGLANADKMALHGVVQWRYLKDVKKLPSGHPELVKLDEYRRQLLVSRGGTERSAGQQRGSPSEVVDLTGDDDEHTAQPSATPTRVAQAARSEHATAAGIKRARSDDRDERVRKRLALGLV